MVYEHPVYDLAAVAAQRRLPELADGRTAFAGSYHGWGFHEDGCRSGRRGRAVPGRDVVSTYDGVVTHARTAPIDQPVPLPHPAVAGRPRRRAPAARGRFGGWPGSTPPTTWATRPARCRGNVDAFLADAGIDARWRPGR